MQHIKLLASEGKDYTKNAPACSLTSYLLSTLTETVRKKVPEDKVKGIFCFVSGNVWDMLIQHREMVTLLDPITKIDSLAEGLMGTLIGLPVVSDAFLPEATEDLIVIGVFGDHGHLLECASAKVFMDEANVLPPDTAHLSESTIKHMMPFVRQRVEAKLPMCKRVADFVTRWRQPAIPTFAVPFDFELLNNIRQDIQTVDWPILVCCIGSGVWPMLITDPMTQYVFTPTKKYDDLLSGKMGDAFGMEFHTDAFEHPDPRAGFRCMERNMIYVAGLDRDGNIKTVSGIRVYQQKRDKTEGVPFEGVNPASGVMSLLKSRIPDLFDSTDTVKNQQPVADIAESSVSDNVVRNESTYKAE